MVDQCKEDISDCKGLRDVAMATKFGQNRQKYHKLATTLVICVNPCRVWFWHRVFAIRQLICDTPVHKGQRGITTATNFGTKIAINAYKCISTRDNGNAITYNGVFLVDQSKEDICDCKGLRDVAMATKFWPK